MAIPLSLDKLRTFRKFGRRTLEVPHQLTDGLTDAVMPTFVNQFWTAGQRRLIHFTR